MSMDKTAIQDLDTVKTLRDHGYEVLEEVLDNTPKIMLCDIKTKTILYEDKNEYKVVAKGLAYALTQTRLDTLKEVEDFVEMINLRKRVVHILSQMDQNKPTTSLNAEGWTYYQKYRVRRHSASATVLVRRIVIY